MRSYAYLVNFQKLFVMLVAVALLFAPAFTRGGEAVAAAPDHHAQMMASGHCQSMPSAAGDTSSSHHDEAGSSCCISMCMALALSPPAPAPAVLMHDSVTSFPPPNRYHGLPAEIATPPPRVS